MKYTLWFWRFDMTDIVGFSNKTIISEEQLAEIIKSKLVNVMIHHCRPVGDADGISYCYIDDLNHRFQPR